MAAPNILNPTSMYGKTVTVDLTGTSATSVLSNASASGKLFRITSLYVCNVDGTNNADITISYYSAAALGGTAAEICKTVSVPADAALVVIDKNSPVYLEEDRSIGATASAANDLRVICSYEELA